MPKMKLKKIFLSLSLNKELGNIAAAGISDDSRYVSRGDVFFVIAKDNFDIFSTLKSLESKICVFVADKKYVTMVNSLGLSKKVIFVGDIKKEFKAAVDRFYPESNFKFIGITGTKGKTTTAYLIYHLLKKMGKRPALIGTIEYRIGNKAVKAVNTTPGYLVLRRLFAQMKRAATDYVVMEVSSHALDQGRIEGIRFSRCVFTNLSREHLDYHKTMKNYFNAKYRFFNENNQGTAIVNADDHYGKIILARQKNKLSFGIKEKSDVMAEDIVLRRQGGSFSLLYGKKALPINTRLIGKHNVFNLLAAAAVAYSLKLDMKRTAAVLSRFSGVEGRLEQVRPDTFVDYAHTHDSLKKTLNALRRVGYRNIICVFGCGGERDHGKRPLMGHVACVLADFSFITSDNPRCEDPVDICRAIERGFSRNNYKIVVDRYQAIKEAIMLQSQYDHCCLLAAGKGHEDYQAIGNKKVPFKDRDVIREIYEMSIKNDYRRHNCAQQL